MRWIKATLWQYLTDLGIDMDDAGIVMPDTPFTPEETAAPDVQSFFYRFLILQEFHYQFLLFLQLRNITSYHIQQELLLPYKSIVHL